MGKDKDKEKIKLTLERVAATAGILALLFTIYIEMDLFDDSPRNSDKFFGIWASEYSYSVNGGVATVEGTTEYFKTGMYNFKGKMNINTLTDNQDSIKVSYDLDGTGTWLNDSENLYITLTNSKSNPTSLQVNQSLFDLSEPKFMDLIPPLESFIPLNITGRYSIVSNENEVTSLEVNGPLGNKLSISMKKVDVTYQRVK
ncbi:hypothetical protein L4D20_04350 [Vibrio kyushuensis]|uniref:hypothetical protein n=1 Tax=Vibrio kyushuensis TaxID=2910249 RepID=UPI003D0D723B